MADAQIKNMISFIDSEAREKAQEIEQEAQDQYQIQLRQTVEAEKKKIIAEYEKKEKDLDVQKRIRHSNLQKEQRLRVLRERDEAMKEMLLEARKKLEALTEDQGRYKPVLTSLIAQAAINLGVRGVDLQVSVIGKHEGIAKSVLKEASAKYKEATGEELKATVKGDLPTDSIGGCIVQRTDGKVKCDNTLKAREATVVRDLMPKFRSALFE